MAKFAYAVIDGNQAPDQSQSPWSMHYSLRAAQAVCAQLNKESPNAHWYVIEWGAGYGARLAPNDRHYVDQSLQPAR